MFKLENNLENWEKQNWIFLSRIASLPVFIVYLIMRRSLELAGALLYFGGLHDHRIQVSPEAPSLNAREHNWALHKKVGPSGFIR
jgi:hypothetical protein